MTLAIFHHRRLVAGRVRLIIQAVLIAWMVGNSCALADYISMSGAENAANIAEIHIEEDSVRINLEVYVKDLAVFYHLLPDDFFEEKKLNVPPLDERLRLFAEEGLQVVTDKGESLVPKLRIGEPRKRVNRASPWAGKINPITRQPFPAPPADSRVFYAELIYPFNEKPKSLTFIPPRDENTSSIKATIGFSCLHSQAIISYFKYLSKPVTIRLDWDDPWYSKFDDKSLQRRMRSGVRSYIYIEPFEVRHEILVRVKDLAAWMDLGLEGDKFIEAHENEVLRERVGQFFLGRENLLVDGRGLRPILDKTAFVKYTMTGSRFLDAPERLPLSSARIGVIITYLTPGIPGQVENRWNLWSERIQKVPTNAIDPVGPFPSYVTPEDNLHKWENFLKTYTIPTVEKVTVAEGMNRLNLSLGSVACIAFVLPLLRLGLKQRKNGGRGLVFFSLVPVMFGSALFLLPYTTVAVPMPGIAAPRMSGEEAGPVVHSLLKNVYRSFDFRNEEDVYDKLALCVDGDILTDIYLQNRKSFEVKQAGGARAKVSRVDILGVEFPGAQGLAGKSLKLKAKWSAEGAVGHWGHIHTRKNLYEAYITLTVADGAWKITGLELIEEKRVDPYTPLQNTEAPS